MRRVNGEDLLTVCSWYEAHGKTAPAFKSFPRFGFIEPDVAAGFLYLTDSSIAMLEGYVTNPRASLRARSKAIDCITDGLLAVARRRGFSQIIALCASRGIQRKSEAFGLRPVGVYALAAGEL